MDGTLADLSSAYAAVEESLFGVADEEAKHPAPEAREQEQQADVAEAAPETEEVQLDQARPARRRVRRTGHRDRVWKAIEATPNFTSGLSNVPIFASKNNPLVCSAPTRRFKPPLESLSPVAKK